MASECGFTEEHYKELQQLQRDFGPYHFNVLAFPCNQFGQQEPGSDRDIDSFIRRVYGVSFPLFSKIAVVGTGANNVYKYLVGECDVDEPLRGLIRASANLKLKYVTLRLKYVLLGSLLRNGSLGGHYRAVEAPITWLQVSETFAFVFNKKQ